jgi:NADH dehydrogenase FAD-containing subunit
MGNDMNIEARTRIVILGGGFGGIYAALRLEKALARGAALEVTLVNRENFFLFTPMLHEIAASDLDITDIVSPIRMLLRRVKFVQGEVEAIDLEARRVTVSHGGDAHGHELDYDHLVIGLGAITNFYNLPGVEEHALTMKSLGDAIALRNRLIECLEEADPECCRVKVPLLTFVVAGGGFAGVETVAAVNDFVREALRFYPNLTEAQVRVVLVHDGPVILPELGERLGAYAQRKLTERKIDIRVNTKIAGRGQKKAFAFKTIGLLASIGRRTGVAQILGVNFSGFVAWWLWRTIYLSKLPPLEKKVRVALDWLLDIIFSKDLVQFRTQRAPTMSRAETEPRSAATVGSRG